MIMRILQKRKEKRDFKKSFVSVGYAMRNNKRLQHNNNIREVAYTNKKIIKPLFFIGAVLPDFKLSWGLLFVYIMVKTPLKKHSISHKISDIRFNLNSKCYKGGMK